MKPFSYSFCATCMVALAPKPSLRLASCWRVVVRNGAYGERRYGFDSTDRTANGRVRERGGQGAGVRLVQVQGLGGALELPVGAEVAALGDAAAVDRAEAGDQGRRVGGVTGAAGGEGAGQVPVLGGAEGDALALPLDDEAGGDGLDAARRQPRHDLLPQDRRDLVAVEAVEDAAGLLGVDHALVQLARVGDGGPDRVLGDLVEDHPVDRDLGLEDFLEVPRDGLALAVLIGGEEEFVGLGQQLLELPDLGLLVGVDHVDGLEVVLDVHAEAAHLAGVLVSGTSAAPFGRSRMCPTLASTTYPGPR